MTPDEVDRLEKSLDAFKAEVRAAIMAFAVEISGFKNSIHLPGTCDLKDKVRDLELQNAKNKGIFVTIGFFVTAVSATISGLIVKFWK